MTDAEITRACAEARGYRERTDMTCGPSFIMVFSQADSDTFLYEPLHDDAQMAALVKAFHLHIGKTLRTPDNPFGSWVVTKTSRYECTSDDLNRAVCTCVAKMWLAKEDK